MNKISIFKKAETFLPALLIGAVVIILAALNYKQGTILTGWDNLHPEYNLALNIKRSIFAVWQEYQGLGLLGGMGHASDLVRQLFLLILSYILPLNFLRYFWTFFSLFIGGTGAYYLIKSLGNNKFGSTLGSIFYILNLSTVQTYYVPYEAFASHFAFLPWLILASINFFQNSSKKSLIFFALVLLISTPAAYVPTLFVVYLIAITIILGFITFKHFNRENVSRLIKTYAIIFLVNAFWLLPFIYFTFTSSHFVISAKINEMATPTIYQQNKEFGYIPDVMLLRGFWFSNIDPNLSGNFTYMLAPWKSYLLNPYIQGVGFALFAVVILGIITCFRKNKPLLGGFILLFAFSFTMLATTTPPFSWIDQVFRIAPLFKEVFRFPFTKFSILLSLIYAVFFAFGATQLARWIKKIPAFLILIFLMVVLMLPAFTGNFIYNKEQLKLPKEYIQLFEFYKHQDPNTRIANLPQNTFWGWTLYKWGYGGSGFLWYGIQQPILDRAFDVWSPLNENYYWDISQTVYSKNPENFGKVLNKYQVNWIVLDKNIINPSAPQALFYDQLEELIDSNSSIHKVKTFGKIEIYKISLNNNPRSFIFQTNNLPKINSFNYGVDNTYLKFENYISEQKESALNYFYPFSNLFSGKNENDRQFQAKENKDNVEFTQILPDLGSKVLKVPHFTDSETIVAADIGSKKNLDNTFTIYVNIKTPQISIKKTDGSEKQVWGKIVNYPLFIASSDNKYPLKINLNGFANFTLKSPQEAFMGTTALSLSQDNILVLTDGENKSTSINLSKQEIINSVANLPKEVPLENIKKGDVLKIIIPKINDGYQGFMISQDEPIKKGIVNCDSFRRGEVKTSIEKESGGNVIKVSSKNATACISFYESSLDHNLGYITFSDNKNIQDRPFHFWILNENQKFPPIDTYLAVNKSLTSSYFVLPPQEEFGKGYSLHFDNISIGNSKTVNEIGNVSIYPIPYNFITSVYFEYNPFTSLPEDHSAILNVSHPNESLYIASYDPEKLGNQTIVLSQGYSDGWKAYQVNGKPNFIKLALPFIFGKQVKNHVMVNNWENGWTLDKSRITNNESRIIIVYLPQYLEYFGFIMTTGFLSYIIFKALKNGRKNLTEKVSSDKLTTSNISPQNADQAASMTK